MAYATSAQGRWQQLDGARKGILGRSELYASYTLPKICPPLGYDPNSHELTHDYQAVGAQAVNHLSNKIMLALFAPSRPFFRADPSKELLSELAELEVPIEELTALLAKGEKDAIAELDRMALRPKLYEIVKNLIITGNVLMVLEETMRVVTLRDYVCRRSTSGEVIELLTKDTVMFDELEPKVQAEVNRTQNYNEDRKVSLYHWIKRTPAGDYVMTVWVESINLGDAFSGKWPADKMPYRALTWDLTAKADYGTGLVEDYKGDFAGLSTLSKAQIIGAVLSSEFRWLVNPAGMTKPEDFMNSENGAAIPGMEGDITLIQSGKQGDLQITMAMSSEYVTRIGRGFLLGSGVTRDAERVTAEEIRYVANELETSLGGAYSRLAVDQQLPIAHWLCARIGLAYKGKGIIPSVITGLEALSRTGDLEDLKMWLADMAGFSGMPPELLAKFNLDKVAQAFALPRRVDVAGLMKSQQQLAQEQAAQQQQAQDTVATNAGINAAANEAATPPEGPPV